MQRFQQLVEESIAAGQQVVSCRHVTARYIHRLHRFYNAICTSALASDAIGREMSDRIVAIVQSNVDYIVDIYQVPIYLWEDRIRKYFDNAAVLFRSYSIMMSYIAEFHLPICPNEICNLFVDQVDLIRDYYESTAELQNCINSTDSSEYNQLLDLLLSQQLHFPAVRQITDDMLHIYHHISDTDVESAEDNSDDKEEGMGTCYVATMQGIPLLLKKYTTTTIIPSNMLRLLELAYTMQFQHISSPYIVPSLLTCIANSEISYVTELAPFGSLSSFLTSPPSQFINDDDVVCIPSYILALIMLDVCSGLQYLHSKYIVHGRLKPTNVLIFDNYRAKLTDIGVSHLVTSNQKYLGSGGVRWYPPEFFPEAPSGSDTSMFNSTTATVSPPFSATFEADIYCLGLIMYFVITNRKPYFNLPWNDTVLMCMRSGTRPEFPEIYPNKEDFQNLEEIVSLCFGAPAKRPNLDEIETMIRPLVSELMYRHESRYGAHIMLPNGSRNREHDEESIQSLDSKIKEYTTEIAASEAKATEGRKLISEREKQVGMSVTSKERKAKVDAIERAKSRMKELEDATLAKKKQLISMQAQRKEMRSSMHTSSQKMLGGAESMIRHLMWKPTYDMDVLIKRYAFRSERAEMRDHAHPKHALQQLVFNTGNAMTTEDELSAEYLLDLLHHEPTLVDKMNAIVVADAGVQLQRERNNNIARESEDSILRPSVIVVSTRNSDYTEAREAIELIEQLGSAVADEEEDLSMLDTILTPIDIQMIAALRGDIGEAIGMYRSQSGYDVNYIQKLIHSGTTALHVAAGAGHLTVVRCLVEYNDIHPDSEDLEGTTPIHAAAEHGHVDVVKYLLETRKVVVNSADVQSLTPVIKAARNGHLSVVQYLMTNVWEPISPTFADEDLGASVLHWSCLKYNNANVKIVSYLIEKVGIDVNIRTSSDSSTPLFWACCGSGKLQLVKYLIEQGADAKLKDNTGIIYHMKRLKVVGQTCLHWAAASGDIDVVKYLVDSKKCSANITDNDGDTPLKVASGRACIAYLKGKTS